MDGKELGVAAVGQVFIGEEDDGVTDGEVAVGEGVADVMDEASHLNTFNRQRMTARSDKQACNAVHQKYSLLGGGGWIKTTAPFRGKWIKCTVCFSSFFGVGGGGGIKSIAHFFLAGGGGGGRFKVQV